MLHLTLTVLFPPPATYSGIDTIQQGIDGRSLMAYRKYSKDYVSEETLAKSRREGLWRGMFEPPWEWRRKQK